MHKLGFSSKFVVRLRLLMALLLALFLSCVSLPGVAAYFQVPWVLLVLLFFVLHKPGSIGLLGAWILGLGLDLLHDYVLGTHGLVFVLMVYVASLLRVRYRLFNLWQKSIVMFVLILGYEVFLRGLLRLLHADSEVVSDVTFRWVYGPALISALLWPMLVYLLSWKVKARSSLSSWKSHR